MSVQENSKIIEKWFAAVNSQDVDGYLELFSEDVVLRSTTSPDPVRGKEAAGQQLEGLYSAFPDYHLELKNAVISDDQFAAQLEGSGTNKGQLSLGPGLPPTPATGKQFRTQGVFVATVKDGKVVEVHQYPHVMGIMMQLGLMSPPGSE
jgi:steroid delta-isomerase-like uncharacterized protein